MSSPPLSVLYEVGHAVGLACLPNALRVPGEQPGTSQQVGRTGDLCSGIGEMDLVGLHFVTSFNPSWFCCFLEHRALAWRRPGCVRLLESPSLSRATYEGVGSCAC